MFTGCLSLTVLSTPILPLDFQDSIYGTQHSALSTQHSLPHSALSTLHSALRKECFKLLVVALLCGMQLSPPF
uniref:Uncharacterized protein n=1 Tax=Desertifilum tharense IPPAS B-1220 TaxID=1781255 RepID=A0ACD5GYE4_9CYAN